MMAVGFGVAASSYPSKSSILLVERDSERDKLLLLLLYQNQGHTLVKCLFIL
jgi:hypothetical protein